MKTILPTYFIFSQDNSLYQRPLVKNITFKTIVLIVFVFALALFCWIIFRKKHPVLDLTPLILFISAIGLVFVCSIRSDKYDMQTQDYNTWGFKVANTNLIALPTKLSPMGSYSAGNHRIKMMGITHNHVDQSEKVKRTKFALYVNTNFNKIDPDKIDTKNTLLANADYLGTVTSGKFKPAKSRIGIIFANYQKYIMQHHLADHFKNKLVFVSDNKYLADTYEPSFILIGDNDYTLHLTGTKKVTAKTGNSKIVTN